MGAVGAAAAGLNPIWLAQSKLRRRRFDECIEICSDVLQANPYDQVRRRSTAAMPGGDTTEAPATW
jgi:hypothetical protein